MYILHTVQFLAVTLVVFRPICSEQMVNNNHNITETVLTSTTRTENSNATVKPSSVNDHPKMFQTIGVYDTDASGANLRKDTSLKKDVAAITTTTTTTMSSTTVISTTPQKASTRHRGREGVTDEPITPFKNLTESTKVTESTTEAITANVTTPHEVVPKKGVTFNIKVVTKPSTIVTKLPTVVTKQPANLTSTTVEPSTTTLKPKKPTVTVGSDEEDQPKNKNSSTVKVPTIEYYQQNNSKTTNFVIPIVAVILSVPIVAIIINILYKRGKEWWSHRHYRRMDFLVDGMYNN